MIQNYETEMEMAIKYDTQIRYEGDVVYIPHLIVDSIPVELVKEWTERGLTIQIEKV